MWQVRVVVRGGRVGDGEQGTDPPRRAGLLMLDQRTANEKETEQEVWQGNEDRGGQRRRAPSGLAMEVGMIAGFSTMLTSRWITSRRGRGGFRGSSTHILHEDSAPRHAAWV